MLRRRRVSEKQVWVPSAAPFFLFGLFYYLFAPAFVIRFLSADNELLYVATRYLDPTYFDLTYLLDALAIGISFLLGYSLAKAITKARGSIADHGSRQTSFPKILVLSFGGLIGYFAVMANMSGAEFFTGYSTYNILILGPFSTAAFLSAWFVNYFSRKEIRLLFLAIFGICAVLLLGWGSRMFFVLSLMALMLGVISKNKRLLRSPSFYGSVAIVCLFMVAIGIAREGGREFGSDNLIAVLFAEPLFTSVSGSLYLENSGGRPIYGFPHDLVASVIHFIPSAIFPGKIELISQITFDENVASPFGARSLLVSLYFNFGIFYPVFIAFIGFYYGVLYTKARQSVFYRATYFSALPILTFLFFREGLSTVIKVMFFNGLVVPLFIALLLFWLFPRPAAEVKSRNSRPAHRALSRPGHRSVSTGRFERS